MARKKAKVRGADVEIDEGDVEAAERSFMDDAADDDRARTKGQHVDDGLKAAKEMVARMTRGIAYASAVHDLEVKLTVLNEIADTASAITDDARRAIRNARSETRNGQPT